MTYAAPESFTGHGVFQEITASYTTTAADVGLDFEVTVDTTVPCCLGTHQLLVDDLLFTVDPD